MGTSAALVVLLCCVASHVFSTTLSIRGGPVRDGSRDLPTLVDLGATHTRIYAMWKTFQPKLDASTLNHSLTVDFVKSHPTLIEQWANSSSVSWTAFDKQLSAVLNASIMPIVEIGEGTFQGLPIYTPAQQISDPNVIGRECYLAYNYLYSRAVVRRYHKAVRLWQVENELNEAYLAGIQGQRLLNLSANSAWRDWSFLTTLLSTLRDAVKAEDPSAQVTMNFHSDISATFHSLLKLPGFYLDAAKAWHPLLDVLSLDAYPCYLSPNASLGSLVGERLSKLKQIAPNKQAFIMETGYPVNDPILNANKSLPDSVAFIEEQQARYMQFVFDSVVAAKGDGLLIFGTWPTHGISPPGDFYMPEDAEAFALLSQAYLDDRAGPLLEWILQPKHWDYLTSRFPKVYPQIEKGWGILRDDAQMTRRPAYETLKKLFHS